MDQATISDLAVKVSEYFRDFLDSDFKKAQAPKRKISTQSDTGFRTAIRLESYPNLNADVWDAICRPSGEDTYITVAPRKYVRPISPVLKQLIEAHISSIREETIQAVRGELHAESVRSKASAIEDPEGWVEEIQNSLLREIGIQIVSPLITHLEGPLERSARSAVDALYSAQLDILTQLAQPLVSVLPEGLSALLATGDDETLIKVLDETLTLAHVQSSLRSFFEGFSTSDAFTELNDLMTYVSTADGFQVYLYLGVLKFRKIGYPLFFLPLEVDRSPNGQSFKLKVVNHLFANRRAIDFALQESSTDIHRGWVSPIKDRITYLQPTRSVKAIAGEMFDRVVAAFGSAGQVEFSEWGGSTNGADVSISSSCYFAAFERADESLINDFEEIIDLANKGGSAIVDLFTDLVKAVVSENPISIRQSVEDEWEALPLVDKLVFDSPIPLNEEQRKILVAIRSTEGRIIVVEGPPGTGKSHTITAIAADCAFNNKSCLVLSDKREALDVVQAKLSDAMSRVRHDSDFPNPLLRLGQQNANFKKLTSNQTMAKVSAYARAIKANMPAVERERARNSALLKKSIVDTVTALGGIEMNEIRELHNLERELQVDAPAILDVLKLSSLKRDLSELDEVISRVVELEAYFSALLSHQEFDEKGLTDRARRDAVVAAFASKYAHDDWKLFHTMTTSGLDTLMRILVAYDHARMPIFGYLFRGARVKALELEINSLNVTRPVVLRNDSELLSNVLSSAHQLRFELSEVALDSEFTEAYAWLAHGRKLCPESYLLTQALSILRELDSDLPSMLLACSSEHRPKVLGTAIRFHRLWGKTDNAFKSAPEYDYVSSKSALERLNTSVMNAHIDTRLVKFMDEHRSDAKSLAAVISSRQKFPEAKFQGVKEAFPVIIASIREFGEYMPLLPNLFDVVVIDEASQVSVAQALPALLRASKVVVLGDSKQFSNVKSSNASIALNEKYRNNLVTFFEKRVSNEAVTLERLAAFDVKKSILEFCSLCASYSVMLRKHFRSYPELISYSSETFYGNQLQAIKVREQPIDEVIRFGEVDASEHRSSRGTNEAEAFYILDQLLHLLHFDSPPTVGIITPFREQQKLLTQLIFRHAKAKMFEDQLRLKIMTFDSCQGEERNIIFYSMVATSEHDALNYVFPIALQDAQESVEEKLRVQRLNVGFSRAQETIWVVHSKPIDEFTGAIGQALRHYMSILEGKRESLENLTDPASPMERKVLDWIRETDFYHEFSHVIEIKPQFPIGEYLRQLDPTYRHPAWRVDFLMTLRTKRGTVKLVIEYDGFEYHFSGGENVHEGNYERYLNEADVERQLVLESYGYRFLRINRFNLGRDPVKTLSQRLVARVSSSLNVDQNETMADVLAGQAEGLVNRELKACARCSRIKPLSEYFDPELGGGAGGVGRICLACKRSPPRRATARTWRR